MSEQRKLQGSVHRRSGKPDALQFAVVDAGQQGHAEDERVGQGAGAKHGLTARRMHRHHRRATLRRLGHGLPRGVGNVVNLQIEKHFFATPRDLPNDRRSVGDERLGTDFEYVGDAMKVADQTKDLLTRGTVNRDDEPVARLHG